AGQDAEEALLLPRGLLTTLEEDPSEQRAAVRHGDGAGPRGERGGEAHRAFAPPPAELGLERLAHFDGEGGGRRRGPPGPVARADLGDGLGVWGAREDGGRFRHEAQDAFRVQRFGQAETRLVEPLQVAAAALQAVALVPDAAHHLVEASRQLLDLVTA